MKKITKRRLLIVLALVGVVVAAGFAIVDWMMKQPLYQFGSVRSGENLRGSLKPPTQTDESRWQVESDISLHFDAYGDGKPVLVVHGGPGIPYAHAWEALESLTDRFKFYYYHQRGCGDSTRPFDRFETGNFYANMTELEQTLGLGAQIADIERIRRILNQEKITIIGHSFGGFIASMYAAEFPNRVKKLILVAPAGVLTPPDEERNLFELARAELPPERHKEYDAILADYSDFGSIFSKSDDALVTLHQRTGKFLLPAMGYEPTKFTTGPKCGGWAVFAMYFSNGGAQDYRPAVATVESPTLILQGVDDDISLAGSKTYDIAIPNSQFVTLSCGTEGHAGHFVFDDCPEEFAAAVQDFLTAE